MTPSRGSDGRGPMKRLREEADGAGGRASPAARLARAMDPLAPSEARKQRVRAALAARGRRRRRSVPAWALRPSVALSVLLGGAALAAVLTARSGWWTRGTSHEEVATPVPAAATSRSEGGARTGGADAAGAPGGAGQAVEVPAKEGPAAEPEVGAVPRSGAAHGVSPATNDHGARRRRHGAPTAGNGAATGAGAATGVGAATGSSPTGPARRAPETRTAANVGASGPGSTAGEPTATPAVVERDPAAAAAERSLANRGMEALRRDHDPARASELLGEYLRRYPDGANAEEALALLVEAADARGDGAAAWLAAQYLRRYPHGQWRAAVRAARDRAEDRESPRPR